MKKYTSDMHYGKCLSFFSVFYLFYSILFIAHMYIMTICLHMFTDDVTYL